MNALELIKSDHERMRALLEEALDAREPQDRVEMLHSIRTELTAHEQMEEEVFYPALRAQVKPRRRCSNRSKRTRWWRCCSTICSTCRKNRTSGMPG